MSNSAGNSHISASYCHSSISVVVTDGSFLFLDIQCAFEILLVAGGSALYTGEAKVSVPAAKSGTFPVFELTAGAQPLHQQPIQEEG